MQRTSVSWLVVTVALVGAGNLGVAQESIFADGFETGSPCRWSSVVPAVDCSGAVITVTLPGNLPLTLVRIPSGTFWAGSPEEERGRQSNEDLHQVTLTQDFYIGMYEVTQAQWQAVMGTAMPLDCGTWGVGESYPVYCVSWEAIAGAGGFIELLNSALGSSAFRLPTDMEWERAARAGSTTRFSYGDVLECGDACEACTTHDLFMWWCGNNTIDSSQAVGSKQENGWGLFDMHGNLDEWVYDWYMPSLGPTHVIDPSGPLSGTARVVRGGDWNFGAAVCRSASRLAYEPTVIHRGIGFRVAMTAE